MKLLGSNFVSRVGIIILAVLLIFSAYMGIDDLELLCVAALILCLISYFWAKFALNKLEVTTRDDDCCGFPGEILETSASLKNAKILPIVWLDAEFDTPENGCIVAVDEEDQPVFSTNTDIAPAIGERFLWVMPHQSILWQQRAYAVHRGVCRLDAMTVTSGDGFGLTQRTEKTKLPVGFRFVVYPAIKPVNVNMIINHMTEMERSLKGIYTDKTLISNIRDYRPGDSFRDINWRMMARQGEVQVNVHEKLDMHRVCLIVDLVSCRYYEENHYAKEGDEKFVAKVNGDEFENMLSLAASTITALHEKGVACSLVIPAYGNTEARILIPEERDTQVMQLLTALAEIDYKAEDTTFPAEEMLHACHKLGQFFRFTREMPEQDELARELDGMPIFTVVHIPEVSYDRQIICETELTAI